LDEQVKSIQKAAFIPTNIENMTFNDIHIGDLISQRVKEIGIEATRICIFFKCPDDTIQKMYAAKSMETELLLKWSKLLRYDFFRVYTQHLILHSPPSAKGDLKPVKSSLPQFRKNIYTKEVIDFVLEQIRTGEMTKIDIVERYKIPKTTLYKWINKYGS
jgi:hypothetical protein